MATAPRISTAGSLLGEFASAADHPGWFDALPVALYFTDSQGRLTMFNRAAAELWGREPELGVDLWCGSWKIFRSDGSRLSPDDCPMALTVRQGRAVRDHEVEIERPDGTRRLVAPHPEPLLDGDGHLVGAVNMLVDVTERRRVERALRVSDARLRGIFRQAAVGIGVYDLSVCLLDANERFCHIVGRGASEVIGMSCQELTHPRDWPGHRALLDELISGQRSEFSFEKRYLRGDGSWTWVNVSMSALLDADDRPWQLISVVEDITERRQFREELERLVADRTVELEQAHRRLRHRERLAALGSLSAGLGHDLANLILPLRARLDALSAEATPQEVNAEVEAIKKGLDYLQRLSAGLRMMASNPEGAALATRPYAISDWWAEAEGVMRAVLSGRQRLAAEFSPRLPPVSIDRGQLTQAVFNLVQNASEALKPGGAGNIRVTAEPVWDGAGVRLAVSDDGPGVSPEVASRCFEPYFSTKLRGVSTGMGLAMVRSAVVAAGGSVGCGTAPGGGARFTIDLPVARPDSGAGQVRPTAAVTMGSVRIATIVSAILDALGAGVVWRADAEDEVDIWVGDDMPAEEIERFLARRESRAVVLISEDDSTADGGERTGLIYCPSHESHAIRASLTRALSLVRGGGSGRVEGDL